MDWRKNKAKIAILAIVILIAGYGVYSIFAEATKEEKGGIAEIDIDGVISYNGKESGILPQSKTTPDQIEDLVERAQKDDVEGYLFRINSPGGQAVASRDLAKVIGRIEKPTTCLMKEVAASGAYWAATKCDHLFADALSITGSIGVSSAYLQYSGLLKEYGIEYVNLTSGKYKDIRSPYKNLTYKERKILQEKLDKVHEIFKQEVADNRNIPVEQIEEYSEGQTFLGKEAKDIGLVDHLGNKKDAIKHLENQTGMKLETKKYQKKDSFSFLSLLPVKIGYGIGQAIMEAENGFEGIEAVYNQ